MKELNVHLHTSFLVYKNYLYSFNLINSYLQLLIIKLRCDFNTWFHETREHASVESSAQPRLSKKENRCGASVKDEKFTHLRVTASVNMINVKMKLTRVI